MSKTFSLAMLAKAIGELQNQIEILKSTCDKNQEDQEKIDTKLAIIVKEIEDIKGEES